MSYTDPSGMFLEATAAGAAACGPVCAGIGAGVDIGIALWGLFGFGGPPPTIPQTLATPSSPILGSANGFAPGGGGPNDSGNGSARFGNWFTGVAHDAIMFVQWHQGWGPGHRTFGPKTLETNNMRRAPGVEKAREFFYRKVSCGPLQPVVNYGAGFGLSGLINAGTDPTQQFVGSYSIDITPNSAGDEATFTLRNTTSFKSLFYGIGPAWNRESGVPTAMGNVSQVFYWTEPIPGTISGRSCGR